MSKHVPGPWADIGVDDRDNGGRRVYGGDEIIAYVCGTDEEHTEANARLIAAAPTLLEALKAAESWVAEYHTQMGYAADSGIEGLLELARAALALAEQGGGST